ncbi:hypothetical protein BD779DRAFT_1532921 [Infundibulicybe gibba]|nr:hypothetical protein BD779DRAFT_1532921 [Infundibulicybe gibba]
MDAGDVSWIHLPRPAPYLNVRDAPPGVTISQTEGSYNTNSHNHQISVTNYLPNVQPRNSIDDVPYVRGWHWDISRACDEDSRIPFEGTLKDINDWIQQQTPPVNRSLLHRALSIQSPPPTKPHVPLYLLLGGAYSGKSTILNTFVKMLNSGAHDPSRVHLGPALFLSPDAGERIDANRIIQTMVVDMASQSAEFKKHMSHTLETTPRLWDAGACNWFHAFILRPLYDPAVAPLGLFLIIIDGLDQMKKVADRKRFIRFLAEEAKNFPPCLRIIISSRPTSDVLEVFRGRPTCRYQFIYMDDRIISKDLRRSSARRVVRDLAAAQDSITHDKLEALEKCLIKAEPAYSSIVDAFLSLCSRCERLCFVRNAFRARGGELSARSVLRAIVDTLTVHPPDGGCRDIDQILWDISTMSQRAGMSDHSNLTPVKFKLKTLPTGPISSIGRIYLDKVSQYIIFEFRPEILALRDDFQELDGLEWKVHQAKLYLDVMIHGFHYGTLPIENKTGLARSVDFISKITAIRVTWGVQSVLAPLYGPLRRFLFRYLPHWLELLDWMQIPNASIVGDLSALFQWLKASDN